MKRFAKNIENRKVLVARLSELTGLDARYTFVPRCAYEIGAFTVEKDGSLTVGDGADEGILQTLASEEMIGDCIEELAPTAETPDEPAETSNPAQIIPPALGTEEWEDDEWGGDEEAAEPADEEEQEVWQPDTDIFAQPAAQDVRDVEGTPGTEEPDPIPDAEYEILQKYLDEGVVLVRQSVADEIREKTGESPAGLYLDGYDFGGEADVCIDVVRDKSHMAYDAIIREITSDQSEDSETDDS